MPRVVHQHKFQWVECQILDLVCGPDGDNLGIVHDSNFTKQAAWVFLGARA